jgi:hypothetical protein
MAKTPLQQAQTLFADAQAASSATAKAVADAQALVTALTPVSAPPSPPQSASPPPPPSRGAAVVPPQAAGAGFSTLTFSTTAFTAQNTDAKASGAKGFQWYPLNWFGFEPIAPTQLTFSADGSVTHAGPATGDGGALTTVSEIPGAAPYFHGTAFGGGFYVEAVFKFDATKVVVGSDGAPATGWPSFWGFALEHVLGHAQQSITPDQWPNTSPSFTGQIVGSTLTVSNIAGGVLPSLSLISGAGVPSGTHISDDGTDGSGQKLGLTGKGGSGTYQVAPALTKPVGPIAMTATGWEHWGEVDFFEYFGSAWGWNGLSWAATIHDWYGVASVYTTSDQYQQGVAPAGGQASFASYHRYGCLLIPATPTAKGSVTFFYDGVQVGDVGSWSQLTPADPPWPASTPFDYGIVDQQHLALVIGGSADAPMTIQSVNVWQADASKNLVN